jgi:ubiquinone biosynthesis protein
MEVMQGLNALFFDYKIKLPANLLLLLKALVIMEGVGLQLDPHYDIIANIGPYVQRLLSKRFSPLRIRRELMKSAEDTTNLLRELPEDVREILRKVKEGKLHIEFEHKGLQPMADKISESIKLLSYTLIVVAIIIGASLIVVAKIPPLIDGVALWGIIGFGLAALLALRTIFSLRTRK